MTAITHRRYRAPVPSQTAAIALGGLTLLLVAAAVVLTVLSGNLTQSGDGGTIALSVTFGAAGFLIALRQSRNPVGWLLMCTGMIVAFTTAGGLYTQLDYGSWHGSLPFGRLLYLGVNSTWPLSMLAGMAAVLLFPDGRLTRPWRRVLWAYAAVSAAVVVTQAIPAALTVASASSLRAEAIGQSAALPGGPAVRVMASGLPVLAVVPFWLAWIARQVASYRRAVGDVRQQFKWFTAGAALTLLGIVVLVTAESGNNPSEIAGVVNTLAIYVTGVAFPLGMAVAILRYRLYDIDRIISRTLAYAIVTGLLVGVYAGVVLLATQALPVTLSTPVAVAGATLAAAALFNPLRRRVQRIVDRRFNRARYDADQTIAAFAARLQDAVDIEAVHTDLLGAVRHALEPAHASLWLRDSAR